MTFLKVSLALSMFQIDMFKITDIGMNPKDENYILTNGKEHLGFWKYETNKIVELFEPHYEVILMLFLYFLLNKKVIRQFNL